jgi:hypothetical protein
MASSPTWAQMHCFSRKMLPDIFQPRAPISVGGLLNAQWNHLTPTAGSVILNLTQDQSKMNPTPNQSPTLSVASVKHTMGDNLGPSFISLCYHWFLLKLYTCSWEQRHDGNHLWALFFGCFVFWDRVLLGSLGWPGTGNPPASQRAGTTGMYHYTQPDNFWID